MAEKSLRRQGVILAFFLVSSLCHQKGVRKSEKVVELYALLAKKAFASTTRSGLEEAFHNISFLLGYVKHDL